MSDKVQNGHLSKSSKELFRDGFKAFKEGLKGAEGALAFSSFLESEASQLLGQSPVGLAELPKILFQLSQSTSVGAVMTAPTGAELMANNAFYSLTGSAGGVNPSQLKLKNGAQGNDVEAPWMRARSWRKPTFERLFLVEGDGGRFIDFYCQPLIAAGGEFEGAFTLLADATSEVDRQEKLKELVFAVQASIDGLKQSSDQLVSFLKSQEQHGGFPPPATSQSDDERANYAGSADEDAEPVATDSSESSHEITSENESQSLPLMSVPTATAAPAEENQDDNDFDPASLQEVVDSASAFILDQEHSDFPEAEDVDGPEELWQEMSDSLPIVLNVDESEPAKERDINLTILEDKPARTRPAIESAGEAYFKDPSGEPARCLVVDDIPVNQKLLVFQLKHFGLNIDTASSGSEALDLITKNNYQIVFMDCDMPGMSGYDTTAEIRRREITNGSRLPVVGMTSHDRDGDKQKCLRAGMNDALPKGVSESELKKAMASVLGLVEIIKPTESGHEPERTFDPQELEELISTFLYAMEMFVSSMQRAIDEKDSSLVRELASSVSGPSRVLGLHDMNKVSQEMVRLSSSGDWPQVRLKYLKLKTVYMRCQEDLRKLCPQAFSQVSAAH